MWRIKTTAVTEDSALEYLTEGFRLLALLAAKGKENLEMGAALWSW